MNQDITGTPDEPGRLSAALAYARAGHAVFGLQPGTKRPYGGTNGMDDASTDSDIVRQWWTLTPEDGGSALDSNIGNRPAPDEFVIDVDVRADGYATLADRIIQLGALPGEAPITRTPTGGRHFRLSYDGGELVGALGPGVDIKGRNGYVVMPPSVIDVFDDDDPRGLPRGTHRYTWVKPLAGKPPKASDAWLAKIRKSEQRPQPQRKGRKTTRPRGNESWADAGVHGELELLARCPKSGTPLGGNPRIRGRNNWLNAVGLRTARLLPNQRNWLHGQLVDACHVNGLVGDKGIKSVEATITSAFAKADKDGPAPVPEPARRNSKDISVTDTTEAGEKPRAESDGQPSTFERPKLWQAKQLKTATQPRWIAKRFVPRAAPTVLCGDEGIGKTLWDIRLIAAVSMGRALPDINMPQRDPQPVLLAAITEEDWSTTVLPRLEVAGADLDMISVICTGDDGSGPPIYPRDFDIIAEMRPTPFLIVVDSWLDTLSANLVVRDSQSAATALAPWTDLATKTDAGIILLTPTNRMASGDIREKYGVTQHLRKKARMTLFSLRDDDTDLLVLGPDKANTTTADLAAMYRIGVIQKWEPTDDDDGTVGRLEYVATSDRSISEWVTDHHEQATDGGDDTALGKAINWLHDYLLENAPSMDSAQVKLDAEAEKIKPMTLRRARRRLRVVAEPIKGAVPFRTDWRLP